MSEEISGSGVFEAAFAAFRKGCAESTGYDDVGWGFGEQSLPATGDVGFGGGKVRCELRESLGCWRRLVCGFDGELWVLTG